MLLKRLFPHESLNSFLNLLYSSNGQPWCNYIAVIIIMLIIICSVKSIAYTVFSKKLAQIRSENHFSTPISCFAQFGITVISIYFCLYSLVSFKIISPFLSAMWLFFFVKEILRKIYVILFVSIKNATEDSGNVFLLLFIVWIFIVPSWYNLFFVSLYVILFVITTVLLFAKNNCND